MSTMQRPSMIALNLIPPSQRTKLLEAGIVRAWVVAGVCGLTGLGAWFGVLQAGRVSDEMLHQQMTTAQSRLALVRADASGVARERVQLDNRIQAARAVGYHPQWAVLLQLLNQHREPGLTLLRVGVAEREDQPMAHASRGATSKPAKEKPLGGVTYEVTLRGLAQSMRAVNDYAVSLEETGVFTSVRTTETGQDSRFPQAGALVSFTLVCDLASKSTNKSESKAVEVEKPQREPRIPQMIEEPNKGIGAKATEEGAS